MKLVVAFLLVAATAPQDDIAKLWPQGVDRPPGLKSYSKTDLNQRLVIQNGFDHWSLKRLHEHDYSTNSPVSINPNSIAPWAVSGGMQGSRAGPPRVQCPYRTASTSATGLNASRRAPVARCPRSHGGSP